MTKALRISTVTLVIVGAIAWLMVLNAGSSVASAAGSVTSTGSMSTAQLASGIQKDRSQ